MASEGWEGREWTLPAGERRCQSCKWLDRLTSGNGQLSPLVRGTVVAMTHSRHVAFLIAGAALLTACSEDSAQPPAPVFSTPPASASASPAPESPAPVGQPD